MNINQTSNVDQLLQIFSETAKTNQQIGVALLKKQQEVEQNSGDAILQLLQSAVNLPDSGHQLDARA